MQFQAGCAKADAVQSALNDIERRHFFGNEQDSLALCDSASNEVDDRLRLPRSGRTLYDHGVAIQAIQNRDSLRAVGINHLDDIAILKLVIEQAVFAIVR